MLFCPPYTIESQRNTALVIITYEIFYDYYTYHLWSPVTKITQNTMYTGLDVQ